MANPLSQFKNDHHVILGVALIGIGVFGVIGSLTGRLPSMLAALFDPSDLGVGATGTGGGVTPPSEQPINSNVSDVAGTGITGDIINATGGSSIFTTGLSDLAGLL